ncbi:MAG: 2-C-methyl-D-erythritol 4-phosphate cytidylyltransferase [Clostridia bacterium]|nr:2-C-methyl-D-erythritol 4-phosphate cytidylyltransferase [Clostridia bacterium]
MQDITEKDNILVSAVIVSAGNSTRMGGINKQFLSIDSIPVIVRTISVFEKTEAIDEIVVVTRESDIEDVKELINEYYFKKVSCVVAGGETRQLSVYNGVINTSSQSDYIAIHDGARPLVTEKVITDTLEMAVKFGAAATGVKIKDTVYR